jgi:hypothetical protein
VQGCDVEVCLVLWRSTQAAETLLQQADGEGLYGIGCYAFVVA